MLPGSRRASGTHLLISFPQTGSRFWERRWMPSPFQLVLSEMLWSDNLSEELLALNVSWEMAVLESVQSWLLTIGCGFRKAPNVPLLWLCCLWWRFIFLLSSYWAEMELIVYRLFWVICYLIPTCLHISGHCRLEFDWHPSLVLLVGVNAVFWGEHLGVEQIAQLQVRCKRSRLNNKMWKDLWRWDWVKHLIQV